MLQKGSPGIGLRVDRARVAKTPQTVQEYPGEESFRWSPDLVRAGQLFPFPQYTKKQALSIRRGLQVLRRETRERLRPGLLTNSISVKMRHENSHVRNGPWTGSLENRSS